MQQRKNLANFLLWYISVVPSLSLDNSVKAFSFSDLVNFKCVFVSPVTVQIPVRFKFARYLDGVTNDKVVEATGHVCSAHALAIGPFPLAIGTSSSLAMF